jgi:cobalt transporter subunit CbtB
MMLANIPAVLIGDRIARKWWAERRRSRELTRPRRVPTIEGRYIGRVGVPMINTLAASVKAAPGATAVLLPALLCIFLGAVLIYGVGFASPMAIHNAAHDARHAFAFPCH